MNQRSHLSVLAVYFALLLLTVIFAAAVSTQSKVSSFLGLQSQSVTPSLSSAKPTPAPSFEEANEALVEAAILEAIGAHQADVLGFLLYQVRVDHIRFSPDQEWATAWLGYYDETIDDMLPIEPGLALARWDGTRWVVTLHADPGWKEVFDRAPDTLIGVQERESWLEAYQSQLENVPQAAFGGYLLPWQAGITRYCSQSVGHDQYTPSGSMHFAFDFYTHDVMWNIYASKNGTVYRYKFDVPTCNQFHCDQPLGNYIVLKDVTTNPPSYQLYLHLAFDSIPPKLRQIGAQVVQGQLIGVADNTGASYGDHLHFQVHTNPNSYFGTAVDITFEDVAINGGRPRVYEYDHAYCKQSDVCNSWSASYTSANVVKGDVVLPTGEITTPALGQTVTQTKPFLSAWAADTQSGFYSAQFMANYAGTWHDIGPVFYGTPFSYYWDMCTAGVPDGVVSLGLRIRDQEGNLAPLEGVTHFIKNTSCPNEETPPACDPGAKQVALFSEPNYQGVCDIFARGLYTNSTFLGEIGNNNAASILVGEEVFATLYADKKFGGGGETFLADDPNLGSNRLNADTTTSMIVALKTGLPALPVPSWPPDGWNYPTAHAFSLSWDYPPTGAQYQVQLAKQGGSTINSPWLDDPYWKFDSLAEGEYTWKIQSSEHAFSWTVPLSFVIEPASGFPPVDTDLPYSQDFESGLEGWTGEGLWTYQEMTATAAHSGDWAWWFGESTNGLDGYLSSTVGDLTSPEFDLPTGSHYHLRFWYRYGTESQRREWDERWVQISVEGGPFTNLYLLSDDPMQVWLRSPALDLSAYAGSSVRLRFHFDAIDQSFNGYEGWFIDDFSLTTTAPPACSFGNEPNNDLASATSLSYGQTISTAGICPGGDLDYYRFYGTKNDRIAVTVAAQAIGSNLDAELFLIDAGGQVIASNDDQSSTLFDPRLGMKLPASGTYYLLVRAWDNPTSGGSNYGYHLTLAQDQDKPITAITAPPGYAFLPYGVISATATLTDEGSGPARVDFYWHEGEWYYSTWEFLGSDLDGSDGWGINFDTRELGPQLGAALFVRAYDAAGNWSGAGAWEIGVDYLPPVTALQPTGNPQGANAFQLQWTASDPHSGVASFDIQRSVSGGNWTNFATGLPPETSDLWTTGEPDYSYAYRMRGIDRFGNIELYPDLAEVTVQVPADFCASPDAYENDNDKTLAKTLAVGSTPQLRNFCNTVASNKLNDLEWVKVSLEAGKLYYFTATPQHAAFAASLELYAPNGYTLIDSAASAGYGEPVWLSWRNDIAAGTYYLRIRHLDGAIAGSQVRYLLGASEGTSVYLPVITR